VLGRGISVTRADIDPDVNGTTYHRAATTPS
jgi:hypothetical protein